MEIYWNILSRSRLFRGIGESEATAMLACLSPAPHTYGRGEYIYRQGENITAMGLVISGSILIAREDYWGNRSILSEIPQGQLFGESYACSQSILSAVSAIAAQKSTVLFFDVQRILSPCQSACSFHTRLIQNLIAVLADKNIGLTDKIEHISQRKLRDKVLSYLSAEAKRHGSADFSIPFNRQELADYLSADRSALSAELSRLRDEGILDFQKNRFLLL